MKSITGHLKIIYFFEILFVGAFLFLILANDYNLNSAFWYIFQSRDILRAEELLSGHLIFFGPELTGGGHLPGPFYYFLLLPPLALGFSWIGIWYWMNILTSLGGVVGWVYFKKRFNVSAAVLWFFSYGYLFSLYQFSKFFVNPSFSAFFLVVQLVLIAETFTHADEKKRNTFFLGANIVGGLAIQLHYSNIFLLIALFLLVFFSESLGLLKLKTKAVLNGLLGLGAVLAPYISWKTAQYLNLHFGQEQPYAGQASNAIPSLYFFFNRILKLDLAEIISDNLLKIFNIWPVPLLFLALVYLVNNFFKKLDFSLLNQNLKTRAVKNVMLVCSAVSFIGFIFYIFVPQGSRYIIPLTLCSFFLFAVIFSALDFSQKLDRTLNFFYFVSGAILLVFLITSLLDFDYVREFLNYRIYIYLATFIALLVYIKLTNQNQLKGKFLKLVLIGVVVMLQGWSQLFTFKEVSTAGNLPRYLQWKNIWEKIYNETGWVPEEAFKKIFFINHHYDQDPRGAFRWMDRILTPSQLLSRVPDGYFVSVYKPEMIDAKTWILSENIQFDIKVALTDGSVQLGSHDSKAGYLVVPYYVSDKSKFPQHFQNVTMGYSRLPEREIFNSIKENVGVSKLTNSNIAFKWNECEGNHEFCHTGVLVNYQTEDLKKYIFKVKIVGLPLAQTSNWISPAWTMHWEKPYIQVNCGSSEQKFEIATTVGYNETYLLTNGNFDFPVINNSWIAPLERDFEVDCVDRIKSLSIGRSKTVVKNEQKILRIDSAELTYVF